MEKESLFDKFRRMEQEDLPGLLRSAEEGFADAQAIVGNGYLTGKMGQVDYGKAMHYTSLAAKQGQAMALTNLGQMYLYGLGVKKDETVAMDYLQQAMELGFMKAFRYAGLCAASHDLTVAAKYYAAGAKRGDITSQYLLGQCYENGLGVERDLKQAIAWYQISAARGDEISRPAMEALERLGV